MIDIHSHILPNVDDGAKTFEESIEMAKIAVSEGIHCIIATPHYIQHSDYLNKSEINKVIKQLNNRLKEEQINLMIAIGQEVYLTPDLPKLLEMDEIATLNNSSYLLIEFPMNNIPIYTEDIIYELKLMGITPIIAHPERYPDIIENPNLLIKFIKLGALCQVNVGSITGLFGEKVKETAFILIKHNMIHLVATDAHSNKRRSPHVKKAMTELMKLERTKVKSLCFDNPFKVYNNFEIEVHEPIEYCRETILKKIFKKIRVS